MRFDYETFAKDRYELCTQTEASKMTGISENVIKNIDAGRKVVKYGDENITKLCDTLGLNMDKYFKRETTVVVTFSVKGGIGKTVCTGTIGSILATKFNKKILLIDCDGGQANLSQSLGIIYNKDYEEKNIYKAFINQESVGNHILDTLIPNLKIVAGSIDFSLIEPTLPQLSFKEARFSNILEDVIKSGEFDEIWIDTPPALSLTNNIILRASDYVLIPFNPDIFSMSGVQNSLDFINQINEENKISRVNKKIKILGMFVNKYRKIEKMSSAITEVMNKVYGEYMFKTIIPFDTAPSKAISENQPLMIKYSNTNVYKAYEKLTKEILDVIEKQSKLNG